MASNGRIFGSAPARTAGPSAPAVRAAAGLGGPLRALFIVALLAPLGCSVGDAEGLFNTPGATGGAGGGTGGEGGSTGGGGMGSGGMGSGGMGSGGMGSGGMGTGGQMPVPSAVCVNEVMPDNETALVIGMGATPDWVELHNPTDAAVNLEGWSVTDDENTPNLHVLASGLTIPPKGFLILLASGNPQFGPDHLSFQLDAGGGVVGLFSPTNEKSLLPYGLTDPDVAQARKPDCCEGDACIVPDPLGTPKVSNLTPKPVTTVVLPEGSMFKYWDTGVSPGATWTDPGFNDALWQMGAAPLGYGDNHIATTVSYGPLQGNKYITTWFRTTFNIMNAASVTAATIELMRDDGAVIYVNGTEVGRSNMPAGAIMTNTLASSVVDAPAETQFVSLPLDPKALVDGPNVLAIELHQGVANSSDLGLDARISVQQPAP